MNRSNLLCFLVFLFFSVTDVSAQDIHFSQYDNNSLFLNPGLTGMYNGDHRVKLSYRDQWSNILRGDAYRTGALSYDTKLDLNDLSLIGLGIVSSYDESGELDFGTGQTAIAASYIKQFSKDTCNSHFLSFGLNLGISQRKIDLSNARWPSQHDGNGGFDPTIPPPTINDTEFLHGDVSIGLVWQSVFNCRSSFTIGMAMHHVNKPVISFLGTDDITLNMRSTIHARGVIAFDNNMSLMPSVLYMKQGEHKQYIVGSSFGLAPQNAGQFSSVQFGYFRRITPELDFGLEASSNIFLLECRINKTDIGLSYDYSTNDLIVNGVAAKAVEFHVSFFFDKSKRRARGFAQL